LSPPQPRLVSSRHKAAGDDDEPSGSHYYLRHLQAAEEPPVRDPIGEGTADAWVERSPSLLRLTGRHPFNGEPPLPLFMRHGFVTPGPLHYVRNHGAVPRADWATWTVEVTGLVRRPARLAMADLAGGFRAGAPRHARLLQRPAQGAEHGAADAGLQLGPRRRVHLGGAARRSATCCAGAC